MWGKGCVEHSAYPVRVKKDRNNTIHSFAFEDSDRDESKYSRRSMKKKKWVFDFL